MNNVCTFSCNNNMCSEASAATFKLIAFFRVLDIVEHWRKEVGRFIFKQTDSKQTAVLVHMIIPK